MRTTKLLTSKKVSHQIVFFKTGPNFKSVT